MTVDWVTPEVVSVGQEGDFELVLRNRGVVTINDIVIEQALPRGFQLIDSQPKPVQLENQPVWMVNQLEPNQEHRIALRLKPVVAGEALSQARVTFSTYSSTKLPRRRTPAEIGGRGTGIGDSGQSSRVQRDRGEPRHRLGDQHDFERHHSPTDWPRSPRAPPMKSAR